MLRFFSVAPQFRLTLANKSTDHEVGFTLTFLRLFPTSYSHYTYLFLPTLMSEIIFLLFTSTYLSVILAIKVRIFFLRTKFSFHCRFMKQHAHSTFYEVLIQTLRLDYHCREAFLWVTGGVPMFPEPFSPD